MRRHDFTKVTETPGLRITQEQWQMMNQRYGLARCYCQGRVVLDVGCGGGQGIRFLAKYAKQAFGGDITWSSLVKARANYPDGVKFVCLDGEKLPFQDASVDTILVFDVIYWLRDQDAFFAEALRVLKRPGSLILASINPTRVEFDPSPLATHYPTGPEAKAMIENRGFATTLQYSFEIARDRPRERIVILLKRLAVKWRLTPAGGWPKAILKRLFLGRLVKAPATICPDVVQCPPLRSVDPEKAERYKYFYCVGAIE
jgi:SAM-dependent methyltransferase